MTAAPRALAPTVCINGRFLAQTPSGVQRFALEIVRALDGLLAGAGSDLALPQVELLVPADAQALPQLSSIRIRRVPGRGNHWWDQVLCQHCPSGALMVHLANGGPVLRGRSLSVLHDAAVYRTPGNFSRAYGLFHRALGRLLALRARICTVSAFSRDELCQVLGLAAAQVTVLPNACEHLASVVPDAGVVARLGLQPGRFFLAIGSPAPNKNLQRAIAGFAQITSADERFVIVGSLDRAVFGPGLEGLPPGVLAPGRLSDAEIAGLLLQARALVFPSLYEGFGIPPLEAMSCGCPVLAADIPVVREVCGRAALLFDPLRPAAIADAMQQAIDRPALMLDLRQRGHAQAARYAWRHSAQLLLGVLGEVLPAPSTTLQPLQKATR